MGEKRGPKPRGESTVALQIKCRREWRDWMEHAGDALGMPVAEFVELAVRNQAKRNRLPLPPARLFEARKEGE